MNKSRWMRPISLQELPALKMQAEADNHAVIAPTHLFIKGQEVLGYASIGAVPLILPWFDQRRCRAADSLYFINVMENIVAGLSCVERTHGLLCVPVMEGSPFEPHIERLGYASVGKGTVTIKKVS